eukprot:jgi/Galph1/1452/GphlegSOOS_G134.1
MGSQFRYKVLRQEDTLDVKRQFEIDVATGLQATPKYLSSTYFYDDKGSVFRQPKNPLLTWHQALYQQITELSEYYLTRCEFEILRTHATHISQQYFGHGQPVNLVELGAGDGRKTRVLLKELLHSHVDFQYVPIDISELAMKELINGLRTEFQNFHLQCFGLVGDYKDGLQWLAAQQHLRKNFVLFLGSSIGNFTQENAIRFIRGLAQVLRNGDKLLLGADLLKDPFRMTQAYTDKSGVTANLISIYWIELIGNLMPTLIFVNGIIMHIIKSVESQLISKISQKVFIGAVGLEFTFDAFESIHTEHSHKYSIEELRRIAHYSGMECCEFLFDESRWFVDCILQVKPHACSIRQ